MSDFKFNTNPIVAALGVATESPFDGEFVSTPAPAVEGMVVGMNPSFMCSWTRAYLMSNLMYNASKPERVVGTTPYTHKQGLITTTSLTDKFRFVLADQGTYLVGNPGTYTVLNPSRAKIAIGGWGAPQDSAFKTDAQFTFQVTGTNGNLIALWVMGSLGNENGNVAVIFPDHLESWLSGNVWHKNFLAAYKNLNLKLIRAMDWNNASNSVEEEWEDRAKMGYPTFWTPHADLPATPYELYCDLAKRLDADMWLCVPPRASDAYIGTLAEFFSKNYPVKRKLWVEHANETWNWGVPWCGGARWTGSLYHTRYRATVDAATSIFTKVGHGLTSGEKINSYTQANDRELGLNVPWQLTLGAGSYVKVLTPDTFELYDSAAFTYKFLVPAGKLGILYNRENEPGKVFDNHKYHGERSVQLWDIFKSKMARKRLTNVLASQVAAKSVSVARLNAPGVIERVDVLAGAPYFDGIWWGMTANAVGGQVTPSVWVCKSQTIHIGVYHTGLATDLLPTAADIIAGNGAVSKQTLNYIATDSVYTPATPVTGLVAGDSYSVYALMVEGVMNRILKMDFTARPEPITLYAESGYVEQALAQELSVENNTNGVTQMREAIIEAGGSLDKIKAVGYEGGVHYHQKAPARLKAWVNGYSESPEFAGVTKRYVHQMAMKGMTHYCQFVDVSPSLFRIMDGYHDVTDNRYLVFKDIFGFIPKVPYVQLGEYLAPGFEVKPRQLPLLVHDYNDQEPGVVYSVIAGDVNGNYAFDGCRLMMIDTKNIDWGKPKGITLTVHKRGNYLSSTGKLRFSLGKSWYEADALFAWTPKGSLNTLAMLPEIGNAVPLAGGTGAVISEDMWKFNANATYSLPTAMLAGFSLSKPTLIASVIDMDGMRDAYRFLNKIGSGNFIATYLANADKLAMYSYMGSSGAPDLPLGSSLIVGKHVLWMFYDPDTITFYAGVDQTVITAKVLDKRTTGFGANLIIGGDSPTSLKSKAKHGCMQVLSRVGMSLAVAKTIVAKMASHHGF
jgi:hypothetical protein